MIQHTDIQLALQAKLLTLLVCTTGSISLAATPTGYSRQAGSFLTDGFAVGMELTPAGFVANASDTITEVSALTITTKSGRTVERAANGRSLSVGLPSRRAWENVAFTPVAGHPYVEEQYIPGPQSLLTAGPNGIVTLEPMYSPRIYVPSDTGLLAAGRYADAVITLFAMKTIIALPTGTASDSLRVRSDVGPFPGQRRTVESGSHSTTLCTIPLRCYTTNPL